MASNCIKVTHFPIELSNADREDLLKHFGAAHVKCVGQKNATVFATFENEQSASNALKRLHQLELLNCRLNAVFAKKKADDWSETSTQEKTSSTKNNEGESHKCYEQFLQSLNAWSLSMDLGQPPPVHLLYLYPPPTMEVVANIARALVAVPKFYNQVLHLMNKMNLPSPFHTTSPQFQTAIAALLGLTTANHPEEQPVQESPSQLDKKSSSESEMESDEESRVPIIPSYVPMAKRKSTSVGSGPKRPKLAKLQRSDPAISRPMVPVAEVFEVGDKPANLKNITMNLVGVREEPSNVDVATQGPQGFGLLFPEVPPPSENPEEQKEPEQEEEDTSYIPMHKLRSNRISHRDRDALPVFRNYQPGAPSCRLYVKNLAKSTTARDLHYIFRAFLGHKPTDEEDNKMFDILHMTEGRMKGQAFVTFPRVTQAQRALEEANGFILNDKPMVIQFGRSKVAKRSLN